MNISSNVTIARGVRINTYANIMHDCRIGEFATIAPNAVLLGRVTIESQAYIGANATILPGLKIGRGAVVGAGAVVTKDVHDYEIVVGIPAKSMNKENR
ncbi:DapH/DapD/GlmU-related protein [Olivibacter sp. XZL3]|uniref:DapH/DapD/GlmU-related protein n=1 Tax=Olivibacter sp. XZL3 TaxID=1735116 RepID=UPI00351A13FD